MASGISSRQDSRPRGGHFQCCRCDISAGYDYYGRRPWFGSKQFVYLEDCYIKKDPFQPDDVPGQLVLGSNCVVCENTVCQGCSIFYTLRFCKSCALANKHEFPARMHQELEEKAR
eukprot:CFRG4123T1